MKSQQVVSTMPSMSAQNQMFSVIAHDMRAPVATLKMIISTINVQNVKEEALLQKLKMLNETVDEVYNLLENLLHWAASSNYEVRVHPVYFDIKKLICECIDLYQVSAIMKNVTICNHSEKPIFVYADEEMVKAVLRNLISNALKFTYQGGRVNIYAEASESLLCICVEDNGLGMSADRLDELMSDKRAFFDRQEKGAGIGLWICREFVKQNGGRFNATSQQGKGSEFCFTLPLKK